MVSVVLADTLAVAAVTDGLPRARRPRRPVARATNNGAQRRRPPACAGAPDGRVGGTGPADAPGEIRLLRPESVLAVARIRPQRSQAFGFRLQEVRPIPVTRPAKFTNEGRDPQPRSEPSQPGTRARNAGSVSLFAQSTSTGSAAPLTPPAPRTPHSAARARSPPARTPTTSARTRDAGSVTSPPTPSA